MPLYDYACTKCGQTHEVRHGFDESYSEPCQACGGPMRRVFNPAPVLFKGSGFYVTDSREPAAAKAEKPKEDASGAKADAAPAASEKKTPAKSGDSAA